ncbi:hypothetical protein NE692_03100 [Bifidobacterium adolescentis]|uniref:Tail fiber protein n=2 Tax=Bifidobacterium adolescentis TaxID=1680 RepID=A0AAW5JUX1_BIFAD|nr:hypothetical protein [Bifidobacterium adolescentis]MCQ4792452.1 hypothetical protein [Bifidobacterium adolescentis]
MTTTLITGKGGTPHITSGDMGAMQAGVIGNGSYLLQGADGKFPAVTMQDANHALIPVLNLVVEGRYARVTEAETATIESGVSGRNRNDLVCLKYTRNGQNIETAAIAVLKGTPNTGTAADPTVPSGSIHSASGTVWIPIARIPISGITPGTPVMLIKQLPPMSKLWDSVTPIHFTKLTSDPEFTISGCVVNGLATVYCRWVNKGTFGNKAWTGVALASMDVRSGGESFNMFVDNSPEDRMQNRFLYVVGNTVSFRTSYDATIPANTWHAGSVSFPVTTV